MLPATPREPSRMNRLFQRPQRLLLCLATVAFPVHAQVVITEIMQNPSAVSDSEGEWFELHNPTGSGIDINGWTISDNDSDSHIINNGGALEVPAGGYIVLARNSNSGANGGVTAAYQYTGITLANGADELVLADSGANEVDRVEWDDGVAFPDPNGASMALNNVAADNAVGSNWCESANPWGVGTDQGTPGAANDCGAGPLPQLVINEIMQNPSAVSDSAGEWIELYNPTANPTDINGWVLSDNDSDSHLINHGGPLVVPAMGYLVLGANTDTGTNGGVNIAYAWTNWFLSNGADEVVLTDSAANEIDRVEYDGGSTFPDPNGASMALVSPEQDNTVGANWCTSPNPFASGSDAGSPGAVNDCPTPGGGNLVINEVDYDQPGSDTAEFVEIRNNGVAPVNLGGYAVLIINGSGGGASVSNTVNLPSVDLAAGDYYVICGDAAEVFACDLDTSPNSNLIQNGSPDAVALTFAGVVVDTVSYEGDSGAPYTEGSGAGLEDSFNTPFVSIGRFPDGVDTDQNNVDFSLRCATPGSANQAANSDCPDPRPPALRINEIDYDQPGSDVAEFVEIVNAGSSPAALLGTELVLVNGSGGGASVYNTIALPDVMLQPFEHFVICANAAATPNCDLDVSPNSNLLQNGAPDAVALRRGSLLLDTVSYEGDTGSPYTEGSGAGLVDSGSVGQDFRGISRYPDGTDTQVNNVDLVNACITPGLANTNLTTDCSVTGPVLEIYSIQGTGAASPVAGQGVTTLNNVVTAVGPEGFFMQTPDARTDGNDNTSDGIYVFTDSAPTVSRGNLVDVSGQVVEFFDFTEFASGATITVNGVDTPLPPPVTFDATTPSPDPMAPSCALEFECREGMLISIPDGRVTGPHQRFSSDPLAEVHITAASTRTFREPGIAFPGLPGKPEWDGNPEVFEMDPDRLGLPNDVIPAGSAFSGLGVLGYEFGGYEFWPTELAVTPASLPRSVRPADPVEMTVGALNLFRLFDDVDNPPIDVIDPDTLAVLRTTDDAVVDAAEYDRRLEKFSRYIRNVLRSPDVLAVSEAESLAVLQDLADRIAADDGAVVYSAWLEEGNDIGGIDVGFLVRDTVVVDSVTQLGRFEILTVDGSLLNDRPPLLLQGRQVADGSDFPFAVMAIHARSLGGIDNAGTGPRVRQKRYEQARFVAGQVQALQDADPDINLVVAGDFNAFEFTDGYVDVTGHMSGDVTPADNLVCDTNPCPDDVSPNLLNGVTLIPSGERYSFIFGGNAQVLDHALTSAGLDELVRDLQYGRGNADAARLLADDASTPLRSSDHDGLVLYLAKDSDGDGVTDDADVCPGTTIPEGSPTVRLRVNGWALVDDDRQFDTQSPQGQGPGLSFDIEDTAGCSCEQIVAVQGLGHGHLKFGCSNEVMTDWVDQVSDP